MEGVSRYWWKLPGGFSIDSTFHDMVTRRSGLERGLSLTIVALFFYGFAGQGFRYSLGMVGSSVLMVVLFCAFIMFFHLSGRVVTLRRLPTLVWAYVLWCCLSIFWSMYPSTTVTSMIVTVGAAIIGTGIGIALPLNRLIDLLICSFKWIIGVSYALELFVAVMLREKLAPPIMWDWPEVPELYYWVNNALFEGGVIQGFMGNRNPFSFVALLLLICLIGRWLSCRSDTLSTLIWVALAVLTLALTKSATTTMASAAVLAVAAALGLVRATPASRRQIMVLILAVIAAIAIVAAFAARPFVTKVLGRSSDMTGRGEIWQTILPMWAEHPVLGWGWTIGWPADREPFKNLIPRADGTPTTQAHNAYIEALFQTGIVGLVLVVGIVVLILARSLWHALSHFDEDLMSIVPFVLMTALVVQSISESRLLFEGNWILLVALATWAKLRSGRSVAAATAQAANQ